MFDPAQYNLSSMMTGCTYKQSLTLNQKDGPKDLAGCTPILYLFKDGEPLLPEETFISLGESQGTIVINIPKDITSTFPLGNIAFRLEVEEENGDQFRYIEGAIEVRD